MRKLASGVIASAAAVALVTAAIALIERAVPVISLGALYLFAVLTRRRIATSGSRWSSLSAR